MPPELTIEDLDAALAGDEDRLTHLIGAITPVIQVRVAKILLRGASVSVAIRAEVEDLVQDILLALFEDRGKILRDWRPERGLSLLNYVGLVTERRVLSTLRSGKKTWRGIEGLDPQTESPETAPDAERQVASRQRLEHVLAQLRAELSDRGWTMFRLLFVEERTIDEIGGATAMKPDAIYAWRSRLRQRARRLMRESAQDSSSTKRIPSREPDRTSLSDGRSSSLEARHD